MYSEGQLLASAAAFEESCVTGLMYGGIAENAVFLNISSLVWKIYSVIQAKGRDYAKGKSCTT